jgi:radical SAM superfamily enzyme YgiQ (UPF0313 family)
MTYWYPGVVTISHLLRKIWPDTPIILGGIYASLCHEHATNQNIADLILQGPLEYPSNWQKFWQKLGCSAPAIPEKAHISLARDLYPSPKFSVILGSRGCPFSCPYCANKSLYPTFVQSRFEDLWNNLKHDLARGVQHFAFYDDAVLVSPHTWLEPLLSLLGQYEHNKITLHAPNALHVRYLNPRIAHLLKNAGLLTVRLGLETANFHNRHDTKLTLEEWEYGLRTLFEAGFHKEHIGAYILFGLPEQEPSEIEHAISFVHQWGIRPHLAEFTPIPKTQFFELAKKVSPYPLWEEPLSQNNSIWPCYPGGFSWQQHRLWRERLKKSTYNYS